MDGYYPISLSDDTESSKDNKMKYRVLEDKNKEATPPLTLINSLVACCQSCWITIWICTWSDQNEL